METNRESATVTQQPSIRELGDRLLVAAKVKFPSAERCGDCRFRYTFHEPSNHPFNEIVDPFVLELQGFVDRVSESLDVQQ